MFFNSLLKTLSPLTNIPPKVSCILGFFNIAIVKATPGSAYSAHPTKPQWKRGYA